MGVNVIIRLLQFCVCLYVLAAVLFTTCVYVLAPVTGFFRSRTHASPTASSSSTSSHYDIRIASLSQDRPEVRLDLRLADPLDNSHWVDNWPSGYASSELLYLSHTGNSIGTHLATGGFGIHEETLLSKAFSEAMHPTRIIPFYFKSSNDVHSDDVTITTLVTSNRFKVLQQLVERYRGPVSVTIHIPLPLHATFSSLKPDHPSRVALSNLHALYVSSPLFSQYVDVHLALSPFTSALSADPVVQRESEGGRQFNVWRNAARLFARTNFVIMLDVDFAVCTDWRGFVRETIREAAESPSPIRPPFRTGRTHESIRAADAAGATATEIVKKLREGTAALVVPAFEYVKQRDGIDQRTFPTDKQGLLKLARANPPVIASFHASWAPGHNSTEYERYFSIPPGKGAIYKVEQYQSAYEPYVITSKHVSWCDERFAGYGGNKAACLFEMYLSGVSYYVLSDHFLIHQSHKYEEEARREERKSNRKLYADFKEESCLRYLYRYYREGTLHTERAANARDECKKIKNITKMVTQVMHVCLASSYGIAHRSGYHRKHRNPVGQWLNAVAASLTMAFGCLGCVFFTNMFMLIGCSVYAMYINVPESASYSILEL
ncbi:glycosyl-transferase for dystroglycan-domain-containing protein [Dichomitus squalens]|uniref:Glycosyl-transferase for dystroglycan-domain-containing protein n=1 Tax=Dichomitus squalens TaxID=114155 RepID=A0A4Q9N2V2_9APHY|nr:glycosyl-transferase for dystroglycan-domain-containing protein [Dichomitus squalens]